VSLVGVPPFGGLAVLGLINEKGQRRKKESVTRNHGFPYRKEGRDSLPGSTVETPQGRRLPAWGFPYRKSDDQGDRWFFKGEIFEMSGAVSADAWMTDFFKKK
jgi:hypothetical protein